MKILVNVSVMVAGLVAIELNDEGDGSVTIVDDRDYKFTCCTVHALPEEADKAREHASDPGLKDVAILRLLHAATTRQQGVVEQTTTVIDQRGGQAAPKKEDAN